MFNGERKVLYYADALTEIAFVVPSLTENSGQLGTPGHITALWAFSGTIDTKRLESGVT